MGAAAAPSLPISGVVSRVDSLHKWWAGTQCAMLPSRAQAAGGAQALRDAPSDGGQPAPVRRSCRAQRLWAERTEPTWWCRQAFSVGPPGAWTGRG